MLSGFELTKLLRQQGYKVTPQRLAVYSALTAERWHPSAEALYKKLQQQYPAMSLATVYKTLDILHKIDAVRELATGEDSFRYDADMSEHDHLQCTCCGEVVDVVLPGFKEATEVIAARYGYRIQKRQFYLFGICPKCSQG